MITPSVTAQPRYSDWSAPVNLGAIVNSSGADAGPALSKDGRSLYFFSTRPGLGGSDIFVSQWDDLTNAWGLPANLGPIVNSATAELSPNLSRDGHWLFFTRGGLGARDIWMSYRQHTHDDFGWETPVNAGPGINTSSDETDSSFFANDDAGVPQLFFARGDDIYVSSLLPDGSWGLAIPVSDLNSAAIDRGISMRFDGLEAFFFSSRVPVSGPNDLWTATRQSVLDPWSAAANLGALVNSIGLDGEPEISADRETLYFNSNRAGGFGALDLYQSQRTKGNK
jgi:Tol biopolymer transport system component